MEVIIVKVLTEGKVQEFIKEVFEKEGKVGVVLSEYIIEVPEEEGKVEKSEIDILKKKYASGDYICIHYKDCIRIEFGYFILRYPAWSMSSNNYKLIHKRHESILKAYLDNPKVEIETGSVTLDEILVGEEIPSKWVKLEKDFLEDYREEFWYRLKEEEIKEEITYPIFKRNDIGEVFRFDSESECTIMFSPYENSIGFYHPLNVKGNMKQIPYDSERQLYDGQPVLCWNDDETKIELRFYDIENKGTFTFRGKRDGYSFKYHQALSPEQLKLFPELWDMYKKLDLDF